jgi:hypothetical protein
MILCKKAEAKDFSPLLTGFIRHSSGRLRRIAFSTL